MSKEKLIELIEYILTLPNKTIKEKNNYCYYCINLFAILESNYKNIFDKLVTLNEVGDIRKYKIKKIKNMLIAS